jgi:co-chaperonin GroES (HSP10)
MKLVPVYDNLVVELEAPERKSEGGLFLPTTDHAYETGVILACGPGSMYEKASIPCPFVVGQKVLFVRYKDLSLKLEDKAIVLLCFEDVLAIIED